MTLYPFHLGFARLAIAAPLLTLFSALVLGRALGAIPTRLWPWVAAVGVLAACYQLCLFASLEQLGVARTALLTVCLPPVLIAGASALVSPPATVGLDHGCPAAGAWRPVPGGRGWLERAWPGSRRRAAAGPATGTLAAIAFALLSALARVLAGRIHPLQAVSFGFVIGAVAPIVVLSGPAQLQATSGAATMGQLVLVLIYLGAVPTALAYICYFYGMQRSPTATSGITATLVEPAVAVLLAAGVLGKHLSPAAWLGVACLFCASVALGLDASWSRASLPANPAFARRSRVNHGR